jgi:CDP-diacylglycerol pyrophosphatase
MRAALNVLLSVAMVVVVNAASVKAEEKKEEKKEVTLKGTIVCTKCELSETKECGNAIKTKIDGKDVVVYFDDKGKGVKYHGKICAEPKPGSVTGVLSEKDKKKYITPAKDGVKYD